MASAVLVVAYLASPTEWRGLPFLLATFAAIPAAWVGARRSAVGTRSPWWLLVVGLVLFNAGNLLWIWDVEVKGKASGDGGIADLLFSIANLCMLAGALTVVIRRGRRDVGGVIDSAIAALAVGGLLWDSLVLPHLTATGTSTARQMALFVTVFVMSGTMGALARISLAAGTRLPAVRLLAWGMAATTAGNFAAIFFTDADTGARPDWTNTPFLVAYALLGCAALHPSAVRITQPGPAPVDDLSTGRLVFLGAMTALIPIVGGGRMILGLPGDGILVALGSTCVIPLVILRIAQLAAQRRAAEEELRRQATHDGLTGLPNRVACLAALDTALADARHGVAVIFCDLDGFKSVNDRLGHAAGDALLVTVAERLRGDLREQELVCRLGGDEFLIICPSDAVDIITTRITKLVSHPITIGAEQVRIGVSAGIAHAGPAATTDELINRADLAMYESKRTKRMGALSMTIAPVAVAR